MTNGRTMSRWPCCQAILLLCAALGGACGGTESAPPPPPASPPAVALANFLVAAEPPAAIEVAAARASSKDARKAVVVGRIANIVPGFGVFTLMDRALPYCGEKNAEDKCRTPWDYCCETKAARTAHSVVVELRDGAGKPLSLSLAPELRLLDLVVVAGALQQDEHGNPVLVAEQVHRRERPELPDYVRWPQ